ncbi:DUF2852 domain-containing protein [Roseovarius sp. 2305UL8-3]|uniref:DUF2852 domain-containing protein n=1 Tax=Roseovarius conchicola TaxID=3121636 RepID=UPI00352971F8
MTSFAQPAPVQHSMGWFARAEAWLDEKGKGAWIVALVLSFIIFWPIGLALLAYMIWSKKMICTRRSSHRSKVHLSRSTGNTAFDGYRAETLRRLEEEQENFEAFLQRLRDARDKAEFDQFMDERAKASAKSDADEDAPQTA